MEHEKEQSPRETSSLPTSQLSPEGGEEEEAVSNVMADGQHREQRTSSTDDSASDNQDESVSIVSFSSCGTVGLENSQVILQTKILPVFQNEDGRLKQRSFDEFQLWYREVKERLEDIIKSRGLRSEPVSKYERLLKNITLIFNKIYVKAEAHINESNERMAEEYEQMFGDEAVAALFAEIDKKIEDGRKKKNGAVSLNPQETSRTNPSTNEPSIPSTDGVQTTIERVKPIISDVEMDHYFQRKREMEEEDKAKRMKELKDFHEKLNRKSATPLIMPIRDPAAMNNMSAVATITPPVAGFNVLSVTPETPRAQMPNTEKVVARPLDVNVVTASKSQEILKDTNRLKELDDFDRRVERQHAKNLEAFVRLTEEKMCKVRDMFVLNYRLNEDDSEPIDDKLNSEPWLCQSFSEQELLITCQKRAAHFIDVIGQKRSQCSQLVETIKSYQKSADFDSNNEEFQRNLHRYAGLTKEIVDITQEFEAVRQQIEEIHDYAKSDLKKLKSNLSQAKLAKGETIPKRVMGNDAVTPESPRPFPQDKTELRRKTGRVDNDDNRQAKGERVQRTSEANLTPSRQDPLSIKQIAGSLKKVTKDKDSKELKKAIRSRTLKESKAGKSDSKAVDEPKKKSENVTSGKMNSSDFRLFQQQFERIMMAAFKQCRTAGDDSPSSDPSDTSSSVDDDDVKKRKGNDDKDKIKKSKNKSSVDKQDPKQSPKKIKGSKSVKSQDDKKVSSPKRSSRRKTHRTRKSKEKGSSSDDDSNSDDGSDGDPDDDDPSDDNGSDSESDSDSKSSRRKATKPVHGKRPDIKTFDGGDASRATFWLRSFINATDTMNWTKIDKAKNFSTYLTGSAQSWFINEFGLNRKQSLQELINPKPIKWKKILKAFYRHYLSDASCARFIDEFNNFAPNTDEKWVEMCQRYWSIAELAYPEMGQKSKVTNLSRKFGPMDANIAVEINRCKTLREVQKICQEYDELSVTEPSAHFSNGNGILHQNQNCDGRLSNTGNDNDDNQYINDSESHLDMPAPNTNKKNYHQDGKAYKKKSPFNIRCFNCWSIGHRYWECPNTKDPIKIRENYDAMIKNKDKETVNQINNKAGFPTEEELDRIQALAFDSEDEVNSKKSSKRTKKKNCSTVTTSFSHSCHSICKKVKKPILNVKIEGIPARALCDTGSDYSHVSGPFAKKLRSRFSTTPWNRPKLYAVNNKEVTPRQQFNNIGIVQEQLGIKGRADLGVIRQQSYDLIVGMDLMAQMNLVIITPSSTFMLMNKLEELLIQNGEEISKLKKDLMIENQECKNDEINHIITASMDLKAFTKVDEKRSFLLNETKTTKNKESMIYRNDPSPNEIRKRTKMLIELLEKDISDRKNALFQLKTSIP